ncbi:hypothetical protein [Actinoplanes regularis]|nr:hypothetical protein [Actinoplanes regularis]
MLLSLVPLYGILRNVSRARPWGAVMAIPQSVASIVAADTRSARTMPVRA